MTAPAAPVGRGPSLRLRFIAIVLLAVIPGFAIAVVASRSERSRARAEAERQSFATITRADGTYQQALTLGRSLLQSIERATPNPNCDAVLRLYREETKEVTNIVVLTRGGIVTCRAAPPSTILTDTSATWFQGVLDGEDFTVSNLERDPVTDTPMVVIAAPVSVEGRFEGVAVASLDLDVLQTALADFDLPAHSTATLLDANDAVLVQVPARPGFAGELVGGADIVRKLRGGGDEGTVIARGSDSETRIYVFRKLAQPEGAVVYAGIPTAVAFADADDTFRLRMFALAIAAVITALIAYMFAELTVVRRTRRLATQAERIGAGDLTARTDVVDGDEIGALGVALNTMAADLQALDAERAQLTAAVVSAGEAERRRIAADVHDDSIQVMSAHVMALQLLRRRVDDPELVARITELEESGRAAIARLRDLIFELHSPVLEQNGLAAAIDALLERNFEGEFTEATVTSALNGEPPMPTRDVAYRIAQEAVSNARRHAGASRVTVSLERTDEELHLEVTDDGNGFDSFAFEPRPGHIGLLSARERADAVGGMLDVTSTPGSGTRVVCRLPWVLGSTRLTRTSDNLS